MDKKIFTLLIICIATISIASVCASEELVSHDFGKFTMDIPESQDDISESQGGSGNQTIYAVPNTDGSVFAYIEYWDTSNTNGNNNTTSVVLDKVKENYTVTTDGNITTWTTDDGVDKGYLLSSADDTQVVVVTSSDTRIQQALNSIIFK